MLVRLLAALIALAVLAPGVAAQDGTEVAPSRRLVLFVADGAGIAYWSAAVLEGHDLVIAEFPVVGLVDTRNLSGLEPESASSATAFAIGETSFPSAVGVGSDSQPRITVLEAAGTAGLGTGLATTTYVVDATPAAFATHVSRRDSLLEIARQLASSGVDVLLGDGAALFDPAVRPDGRDLIGELARTHTIVRSSDELAAARRDPPERLVGFFDIDSIADPSTREPSLTDMVRTALAVLDAYPKGFFLLVENEHTDHRGHDNAPLATIVAEIVATDLAVRAALEYREEHPETLVVVVGDHETGGLSLESAGDGYRARWATTGHTAELVPIFAVGPGAERFAGILTGAEVGRALLASVRGAATAERASD
ncbi:MAG: alkaline phosphatase [Gemmatimonadetes bacterium]|nr:alkaline phosphatase [Gemmatimonadota bacterium]